MSRKHERLPVDTRMKSVISMLKMLILSPKVSLRFYFPSVQCGRPVFSPWVGKIPWRRERVTTPVFWPGEFHGLHSPWCHKELDTVE